MEFKNDINARIHADFGENAHLATAMFINGISKADYLKTDRVVRCILFLAKGNLTELQSFIDMATFDPRDVMALAEYEKKDGDFNYVRLRDFNKTFEECTNDVRE
jgi:galactose-1-phosphate uridylyltransferase